MKITQFQIRNLVEELIRSEMNEFSSSKPGKSFMREGDRIRSSARKIYELSEAQTGKMRGALVSVADFVDKLGGSIASINDLEEGSSITDTLPSVQELKKLHKAIKTLE